RVAERRHRLVDRAADHVAGIVEDGERLAQSLLVDRDGRTKACRGREKEQADEPVQEVLPAPGPERSRTERVDMDRLSQSVRQKSRGLKVPTLWLPLRERVSPPSRQSDDLSRGQP